jgi:hypothetical protein
LHAIALLEAHLCNPGIIQTVGKLQKKIVIKFGQTDLRIIVSADEGGVQIWSYVPRSVRRVPTADVLGSTIRTVALFYDYRIQSNSNNEISISLNADALEQVLHSAQGNEEVVMKLAKKDGVCVLKFEIIGASRMGRKRTVSHDVRIDILRPNEVEKLREPECPEPDVRAPEPRISVSSRSRAAVCAGAHSPSAAAEDQADHREAPCGHGCGHGAREPQGRALGCVADGGHPDGGALGEPHEPQDRYVRRDISRRTAQLMRGRVQARTTRPRRLR